MTQLQVDPRNLTSSVLTPPISKSDAQRALVLAHLTGTWPLPDLQSEPEHFLPADVRVLTRGIEALRMPQVPCATWTARTGALPSASSSPRRR